MKHIPPKLLKSELLPQIDKLVHPDSLAIRQNDQCSETDKTIFSPDVQAFNSRSCTKITFLEYRPVE